MILSIGDKQTVSLSKPEVHQILQEAVNAGQVILEVMRGKYPMLVIMQIKFSFACLPMDGPFKKIVDDNHKKHAKMQA